MIFTKHDLRISENRLQLANLTRATSIDRRPTTAFSSNDRLIAEPKAFSDLLGNMIRELDPVRRLWMIPGVDVRFKSGATLGLDEAGLRALLEEIGFVRVRIAGARD